MEFTFEGAQEVLKRTPTVLFALLEGLSAEWIHGNEGDGTWSPKEVVAHLIICEQTNWVSRIDIILSDDNAKISKPIDMVVHFELAKSFSSKELLHKFAQLRQDSLEAVARLGIDEHCFHKTAVHPTLGTITLGQLLATWVAHDLSHIAQISRVMAKQYKAHVGPFASYLNILKDRSGT
jgi:uncharacterized damage-inducible protein DinB